MSPFQIKDRVINMINSEASKKEKGRIIVKVNSLVDQNVIKALYKASMEGVKIDLIVRGICCLKPEIKELSENITVISIVGKYLEHARIFYFKHSNPSIFISSADWMPRNLERRLELMTPIYDESLSQKLFETLELQLKDTALSWKLLEDGSYKKIKSDRYIDSQEVMESYINKIYKMLSKDKEKKTIRKLANKLIKES